MKTQQEAQAIERISSAVACSRSATTALLAALSLVKENKTKVALVRLHIALNILASATQSANAACENLLEDDDVL